MRSQLPFEKKTDYEYMDAHLHTPPPRPTSIQADIPKELEAVILKAIEKDPEKRFQNALEFRSALIKVGMLHVKAYRRLKTMRNDKDRAVLSSNLAPRITRDDFSPASQSEVRPPSLFARLSTRRARYVLGAGASFVSVAVMALALGYYLAQKPGSSVVPSVPQPLVNLDPFSPGADTPRPLVVPEANPVLLPAVATSPGVAEDQSVAEVTPPAPAKSQHNVRNTSSPRDSTGAKKTSGEGKKYDALRKAWGG